MEVCLEVSSPVAEDNGQQQVLQREPVIYSAPPWLAHLLKQNNNIDIDKKSFNDFINHLNIDFTVLIIFHSAMR